MSRNKIVTFIFIASITLMIMARVMVRFDTLMENMDTRLLVNNINVFVYLTYFVASIIYFYQHLSKRWLAFLLLLPLVISNISIFTLSRFFTDESFYVAWAIQGLVMDFIYLGIYYLLYKYSRSNLLIWWSFITVVLMLRPLNTIFNWFDVNNLVTVIQVISGIVSIYIVSKKPFKEVEEW